MNRTPVSFLGLPLLAALAAPAWAESGSMAAGSQHTCAVSSAGAALCWGRNPFGQVGDGTVTDRLVPVPVIGLGSGVQAIVAGTYYSCALTTLGAVRCWGSNDNGQLGDGTQTDRSAPVAVTGLGSGVQAIAAGVYHSCALTALGAVQCWGSNNNGQLGDGTQVRSLVPVPVTGLGSGVQAIAAGDHHMCALTSAGAVRCWGKNDGGQLGNGAVGPDGLTPGPVTGLESGIQAIATGEGHSCALDTAGGLRCWGRNSSGQGGNGSLATSLAPVPVTGMGSGTKAVVAGNQHTCALSTEGAVQCWGYDAHGQLGDGTFNPSPRPLPAPVIGLGNGIRSIVAGEFHTCALTTSDAMQCWGNGSNGQLGDGTIDLAATPRPVLLPGAGDVIPGITLRPPASADQDDQTGASVAIGDDDANATFVVGAPGTAGGGSVYLYVRPSSSLASDPSSKKTTFVESLRKNATPAVVLNPPAGGGIGDKWGQAVAAKPDGSSIAVGAPQRDGNGVVFVFHKPAGGWDSVPGLTPAEVIPAPAASGQMAARGFGETLAYASDGTLVVGAPGTNVNTASAAGAAFAYRVDVDTGVASLGAPLTAVAPQANAKFGAAVAANDDVIAIGAPQETEGAATQQGAAYLFQSAGSSVGPATRIRPAGGALGDKFGAAVAVDTSVVVVGAPGDTTAAGTNSGSARVFRAEPGGIYNETVILLPAPGVDQGAGMAVAARAGNILLGAPLATAFDKPQAGRAYLYQPQDLRSGADVPPGAVLENQTGDVGDEFGRAVALGRKRLGIGVPNDDEPDGAGVEQKAIGRTDTFNLDGIFSADFE